MGHTTPSYSSSTHPLGYSLLQLKCLGEKGEIYYQMKELARQCRKGDVIVEKIMCLGMALPISFSFLQSLEGEDTRMNCMVPLVIKHHF